MTAYGSKVYGSFIYGSASVTDISVYPFTTQCLDYGTIKLSWIYPLTSANFTTFVILRSQAGFPMTADTGDLIYKTNKTALSTAGSGGTSLLGLAGTLTDTGSIIDPITGLASATYTGITTLRTNQNESDATNTKTFMLTAVNSNIKVGQTVSYAPSGFLSGANSGSGVVGGTKVAAVTSDSTNTYITLNDYATIPVGTALTFSTAALAPGKVYYYSAFVLSNNSWVRVGTAIGTSVKNYKTADTMYDSLPEVYRAALPPSAYVGANKNVDLYNFLRTFGVQYDFIKTKIENATNRYDVNNIDGRLLPALMDQLGFNYESGIGVQQGKRLLKNASYIYLNKGTVRGVKQFVSSFTGYGVSVNAFKNLFLTLDCSSFEYSDGFWGATGLSLFIGNTTATLEGGTPSPFSVGTSPAGYQNAQSGYLKVTMNQPFTNPYVSSEISYGVSVNNYTISTTTSNNSTAGYRYVTLTTDTEHEFTLNQYVAISNMQPPFVNGTFKVIGVPDSKSFTIFASSLNFSSSVYPNGTASIGTQTPTGTTNITITAGAQLYIVPGQTVTISNVIPTAYNGTWTAQSGTTGSTLVVNIGSNPGAITGAGTVSSSPGTVSTYDPRTCGIPITSGTSYQFSVYSWAKTTARSIVVGTRWYDQYGTYLSSATESAGTNSTTSWTRLSFAFPRTAPANAAFAVPYFLTGYTTDGTTSTKDSTVVFGEVHYFDAAQFEAATGSTATAYADARRTDFFLTAPRINSVINPGFEAGTTGWTVITGGSLSADTSNVYPTSAVGLGTAVSTQSAKITASGTSTVFSAASSTYYMDVTAGNSYSVSAYVKGSHTDSVTIGVSWYAGASFISTDTSTSTTLSTSTFTRISWTPVSSSTTQMIAPATATKAVITLTFTGVNGHIYYVDSVLFEASQTVNSYFDGSTGYNNVDDTVWEQNAAGTKGTSITGRSLYYPNRVLIQSRLNSVIYDYLPFGTNYAVFIGTTAT